MFLLKYKINKFASTISLYKVQENEYLFLKTVNIKNYYRIRKLIKEKISIILYKEYIKEYFKKFVIHLNNIEQCIIFQGNIVVHKLLNTSQKEIILEVINIAPGKCVIIIILLKQKYNGCKLKKLKRRKYKRVIPENGHLQTKKNFTN